jgi:hypothetical protein
MINEEKQKKLIDKAKEIFGITDSCKRAGYILPDGEMLDFGTNDRPHESRYYDHSEVLQVYSHFPEIETIKPNGQCFVYNYNDQWQKETGAIRFSAPSHYQMTGEMFQPHTPTKKQFETLEYCNCILKPSEQVILEFGKCSEKGKYIPKNFSAPTFQRECTEPINSLKSAIKKWKREENAKRSI